MIRLVGLVLLCLLALPLRAQEPRLQDPELEARAEALQQEIRCVVCQNESIETSRAGIARDLRILVRERLAAGDSDEEIRQFLVARYGDYVLFRPPMRPGTWLLWFGPAGLLILGAIGIGLAVKRRQGRPARSAALNEEERQRLAALLRNDRLEGSDR